MLTFEAEYRITDMSVDDALADPDNTSVVNMLQVTITGVDDAPEILSADTFEILEDNTVVATILAEDADRGETPTFAITGGADDTLFEIDETTGELAFLAAPDFEAPGSADGDNSYDVQIAAISGANTVTQDVTVDVLNGVDTITGSDTGEFLFEAEGPLRLEGQGGDDWLGVFSGGATLFGGTGNDRYYVYDSDTVITELPGEGYDIVYVHNGLCAA